MIIVRGEAEEIKKIHKWLLVYGRRKTGKTFLLRNFTEYDEYYFVKRDREILTDTNAISYDTFLELFKRQIDDGRTVIVDEFHRLGEEFQDILHFLPKKGKVILVSSTLHLSRRIVGSQSPLLGILAEFQMPLLHLLDVLRSLQECGLSKKELVETAVLLREPIAVDYFSPGETSVDTFTRVMTTTKYLVPALIGEVFTEEDRSLSAVYEGILRAIAS
ncbi:MAG: AAA family ATPase, partial [Methanopyri archaeon]|nr:AAA family ATPase [Methanopyri archaeon]